MNAVERAVAEHYTLGNLHSRILQALRKAGADPDNLTIDDLAAIDEFHIGGREATLHVVKQLTLSGQEKVIDLGCGIGGAARVIAAKTGCHVVGIDLTPEFIEVAELLAKRTGLEQNPISLNRIFALASCFWRTIYPITGSNLSDKLHSSALPGNRAGAQTRGQILQL